MKKNTTQKNRKAIKLIQDRSSDINKAHLEIANDIDAIKKRLADLGAAELAQSPEYRRKKDEHLAAMSGDGSLAAADLEVIHQEAEVRYPDPIALKDILTIDDWREVEQRLDGHIADFNRRYSLDGWDYAIAGSCGLFAAMLDLLCVRAPPKPTVGWSNQVNGVFNTWVQKAFNRVLPPDLGNALSKANPIGAPDCSVTKDLIGAPSKVLNPLNHRLRSLAHDPLFGFLFGVCDTLNGTCTVVTEGRLRSFPSTKEPTDGNILQMLGRMLGHLLSDVNAPSAKGNRGMGLPAPFMGLLRMFEGIPVGDSDFGKQIEWMYINGYDFRQFVVTSIPMTIMEVLLRAFYVVKQMKLYDAPLGQTIVDTMPVKLNPRFRMMLALAYGTSSAVNAGKMYITQNILNANYASWMGLVWNGFHALKWALLDRHLRLWDGIEQREIEEIESIAAKLGLLQVRASQLPT